METMELTPGSDCERGDEEKEEPASLVTSSEVIQACIVPIRHCNQTDSFGTLETNACFIKSQNRALEELKSQRKQGDIRFFFKPIAH